MSIPRLLELTGPTEPSLLAESERAQLAVNRGLASVQLPTLSAEQSSIMRALALSSPFIVRILSRTPTIVSELLDLTQVQLPLLSGDYRGLICRAIDADENISEVEWMRQLRQLRHREMVRIAVCDLMGLVPLATVLHGLSSLADAYIQICHDWSYQTLSIKHGVPIDSDEIPQSLLVLGMGKLGGEELNYSSDIDLIFFYPQSGMTQLQAAGQSSIENQQFFTLLGQRLIRLLNDVTEDGFVFRVDMRLRPNGESGPLVMNFSAMEIYYQAQGRDWERYAFIKARVITGHPEHIRQFTTTLKPFIYRRYLDYGAFAALREMKGKIMREVTRRGMRDNIKLGSGGIREIEFIGQTFQLIRGGREPALQQRPILKVLAVLAENGILEATTVEQLKTAYHFLRRTENRLQIVDDQQTHQLPSSTTEQLRLAYSMGFETYQEFKAELDSHLNNVELCFADVFSLTEGDNKSAEEISFQQVWLEERSMEATLALLQSAGFTEAQLLVNELEKLRNSYAVRQMSKTARERLDRLIPLLLKTLAENNFAAESAISTFTRFAGFIQAVARRSVYLALLTEYPAVLQQLVQFFAASSWLAEYLTRHPVLLDGLIDSRVLNYLPDKARLRQRIKEALQGVGKEDIEQAMDILREFKNEIVLRVAAVDIKKELPLMKVSDRLTELAEVILETVHEIATRQLVEKHGQPMCRVEGQRLQPELGIVGYGKLGGVELAYSSDLDLVFLNNSRGESQRTEGPLVLENDVFYMRMAQRMMHMLGAQTGAGLLYEPDVRLRPDGVSGLMVSTMTAYERYELEKAWVWEHQALVRARMIVGSEGLKAEFERIRHKVLSQARNRDELRQAVLQMREKMRTELSQSKAGEFDLKHDAGGIVDIEFMVQYGVLAWAHQFPELTRYTDNIRILEYLVKFALLDAATAEQLMEVYRRLRERGHRLTLLGKMTVVPDDAEISQYKEYVVKVWRDFMGDTVKSS